MSIKWGVLGTANIADWGVIPGMLLADVRRRLMPMSASSVSVRVM